jgi:riboflavin kinase / FMN adenylyltransferase
MQVIKSTYFNSIKIEPGLVLALGSFDGLHIGHQAIILETKKIAQEMHLPSGVYTFNPHPLKILKPAVAPAALISPARKIELFTRYGIDYFLEQEFTREFSRLDYRRFIDEILVKRLNIAHIVIGEDFRFGYKGEGDLHSLSKLGQELGFKVTDYRTVRIDGQKVSSTLIRQLIKQGDLRKATEYSGHYYHIDGRVIHGDGRGHNIGIPTANLQPVVDYVLPPAGVYACFVYYQGRKYKAITNFGIRPTFGKNDYAIEIHILNFPDQDIYGGKISLEIREFIRKEMTFKSINELLQQIRKDILYTESHLCYN